METSTITVRAAQGARVPYERQPRKYIVPESGNVEVPNTHYYQQQIRDGDLILVNEAAVILAIDSEQVEVVS